MQSQLQLYWENQKFPVKSYKALRQFLKNVQSQTIYHSTQQIHLSE